MRARSSFAPTSSRLPRGLASSSSFSSFSTEAQPLPGKRVANSEDFARESPAMGLPAESLPPVVELRPSFDLEAKLMEKYEGPVAGVDEAGRGPWEGPVVAAFSGRVPNPLPEGSDGLKKP